MGITDFMENLHQSTTNAHEKGDRVIELLEEMTGHIAELLDTLAAEDDQDTYSPYVFQTTLDGTGAGTVILERRPGYVLELVSLATVGAAANSGLQVYANDQTPQNLLYAGTIGAFFSDSFQEGSIVPDGSKLIVVWTGAGAGGNVTATIRGKKRRLDAGYLEAVA